MAARVISAKIHSTLGHGRKSFIFIINNFLSFLFHAELDAVAAEWRLAKAKRNNWCKRKEREKKKRKKNTGEAENFMFIPTVRTRDSGFLSLIRP